MQAEKTVDLLKLIRGEGGATGLKIIKVDATEPDPVTFIVEGTPTPLDLPLFEVPVSMYPLRKGDRFLAYPLISTEASQRWGVIQKLTSGLVMATMESPTSLKIPGINKTYGASDLVIPPFFAVSNESSIYSDSYTGKTSDDYLKKVSIRPLKAGDKVSIAPTYDEGAKKIKYVILEKY